MQLSRGDLVDLQPSGVRNERPSGSGGGGDGRRLGPTQGLQSLRTEETVIGVSCEERLVAAKVREVFLSCHQEEEAR